MIKVQRRFNSGQISRRMRIMSGAKEYETGLHTCLNMMPTAEGVLERRPGIMHLGVKNYLRLIPFDFNGNQFVIGFYEHEYYLASDHKHRIEIDVLTLGGTTVTTIYSVSKAFSEPLYTSEMSYVQSGDTLYLTNPIFGLRKLVRAADGTWSLTSVGGTPSTSKLSTISITGTAGSNTLYYAVTRTINGEESLPLDGSTASLSLPTALAPVTIVSTLLVGTLGTVRIYRVVDGTYGFIGESGSGTFVDDGKDPDFTIQPPKESGLFYTGTLSNGKWGFNRVGIVQQRLVLAGVNAEEINGGKIAMSQIGRPENFTLSTPVTDSSAFTFYLSDLSSRVTGVFDNGRAIFATDSGIFTWDGLISPLNPNIVRNTATPSSYLSRLDPILFDDNVLTISPSTNSVHLHRFDNSVTAAVSAVDISIPAKDLIYEVDPVCWCMTRNPTPTLWIFGAANKFITARIPQSGIIGWSRNTFSSNYTADCVAIDSSSASHCFMVSIDGAYGDFYTLFAAGYRYWLDWYKVFYPAGSTTLNMAHVNGQTVIAATTAGDSSPKTASSSTDFSDTGGLGDYCTCGVPYTSRVTTLPIEPSDGTLAFVDKRPVEAAIWVGESGSFKAGMYGGPLEEPSIRQNEVYGAPENLLNGWVNIPLVSDYDREGKVSVEISSSWPLEIHAIAVKDGA